MGSWHCRGVRFKKEKKGTTMLNQIATANHVSFYYEDEFEFGLLRERFVDAVRSEVVANPNPFDKCGTWHFVLANADNIYYAMCLGWRDDGTLGAKIACQPRNSLMSCDYDWDWMMPVMDDEGGVWDTDTDVDELTNPYRLFSQLILDWQAMSGRY